MSCNRKYSNRHAHPQNAITTPLEAAHIIPFMLRSFQANDSEAVDRHTKIWVNLSRYFPVLRSIPARFYVSWYLGYRFNLPSCHRHLLYQWAKRLDPQGSQPILRRCDVQYRPLLLGANHVFYSSAALAMLIRPAFQTRTRLRNGCLSTAHQCCW